MENKDRFSRLIAEIQRPVTYRDEEDLRRLARVQNLGHYMIRKLHSALRVTGTNGRGTILTKIVKLFEGYDALPAHQRSSRLREVCRLIEQGAIRPDDPESPGTGTPVKQGVGTSPEQAIPWDKNIQYLKGVGPKRAEQFKKLGIENLEDFLYFAPWRYEDRQDLKKVSQLVVDQDQTVCARILSTKLNRTPRKGLRIFEIIAGDETGYCIAKWFNQPYLKNVLEKGKQVMLSGRVRHNTYEGGLEFENPQFEIIRSPGHGEPEDLVHTGRIVPVYHETQGLTSRVIRSLMKSVLDRWRGHVAEILPRSVLKRHDLPPLREALQQLHFPDDPRSGILADQESSRFYRRLIFEDFFLLQLGLSFRRLEVEKGQSGIAFRASPVRMERFLADLPFTLTAAQRRVIDQIGADMAAPRLMNRLLQGDVGCGKTLVAVAALLTAIENGYQGAFMAPTEILAEQHFLTLRKWLSELGVEVALLTGSVKPRRRQLMMRGMESGKIPLVVGTHALIQEGVKFRKLGLVVVDEQHKFGVLQRKYLAEKGYHPDILIMTATPIPRTLALSVYGDMEVSTIDEMPPGRQAVQTLLLGDSRRSEAYRKVIQELTTGHQAYVVCPLVDPSAKTELKAATQMADQLSTGVFRGWRLGLLHGQMDPDQKESVMGQFKSHQLDLLVSTSIIEVGIDVPNATIILIEQAERFGLAQLHQMRGRVGRSAHDSLCILLPGERLTEEGRHRLEVLVKNQDGFSIAEHDLAIRGPGEFFGTRQSGLPELRVANLLRDVKILELSRQEAFRILKEDPHLKSPEHQPLKDALCRRWKGKLDKITVA